MRYLPTFRPSDLRKLPYHTRPREVLRENAVPARQLRFKAMNQPNSSLSAILHDGETASPPRWRGPPYHDLRIAKVASCIDGATSESTASRSPSPSVTPSESSNYYAASTSSWATSAGPGTECGFPNDDDTERDGRNRWDDEYVF